MECWGISGWTCEKDEEKVGNGGIDWEGEYGGSKGVVLDLLGKEESQERRK